MQFPDSRVHVPLSEHNGKSLTGRAIEYLQRGSPNGELPQGGQVPRGEGIFFEDLLAGDGVTTNPVGQNIKLFQGPGRVGNEYAHVVAYYANPREVQRIEFRAGPKLAQLEFATIGDLTAVLAAVAPRLGSRR